ncbi:winged helix DNA-binding domain-containing protein [Nocardia sp. GCM10030253]|uniref:winged helix DNA-binding domain-containing protein n=1 Tax=Nocardia sp. GCM10030253 TaxID=3273404 RepID=UPI00363B9A9B
MQLTWDQVFAWRLGRQFVAPRTDAGVPEIVDRLCGVQAQVTSSAELAVALRRGKPEPDAVVRELNSGTLIKTWAMRGTLHALAPDFAAAALAVIASARTWEKPVWQRNFGASPAEVAALVESVSNILDGAVLTRDELVEALVADPALHRLGEELRSGWGALLKPLAWQGALCHGPAQGNRITFTTPAHQVSGWRGLPEPDAAAPIAITGYLRAYGPATPESFDAWLSRNSLRKTIVRKWFAELGDALTEVEVAGRRAYVLTEHADELAATQPVASVHLLGAFDQYVLGPGTSDSELLPAEHRSKVSRAAGWISPIVVVGGRIAGTWEIVDGDLVVAMFDGAAPPKKHLATAADHLAVALGQDIASVRAQ